MYDCQDSKLHPGSVEKVVHLRAIVEGLKLVLGVLKRLAAEGEKSSLRNNVDRAAISHFCFDRR